MYKQGTDPDNVQPQDILCDFCHTPWDGTSMMIEGHRGSCICSVCLERAAAALLHDEATDTPDTCILCLREARAATWRHPDRTQPGDAAACRGCVRRSVRLSADA